MGITSQRRWRQKARGETPPPPAPPRPASIPFGEHERAIQDLTVSYEHKLTAAKSGAGDQADLTGALERLALAEAEIERLRALLEGHGIDAASSADAGDDQPGPYDGLTKAELLALAKERGLEGVGSLNKTKLLETLLAADAASSADAGDDQG